MFGNLRKLTGNKKSCAVAIIARNTSASDLPDADHGRKPLLDQLQAPHVVKARGQFHHPDRAIHRARRQRSGIRRDRARIKRRYHRGAFYRFKTKEIPATLCRRRDAPGIDDELLRHNGFR